LFSVFTSQVYSTISDVDSCSRYWRDAFKLNDFVLFRRGYICLCSRNPVQWCLESGGDFADQLPTT